MVVPELFSAQSFRLEQGPSTLAYVVWTVVLCLGNSSLTKLFWRFASVEQLDKLYQELGIPTVSLKPSCVVLHCHSFSYATPYQSDLSFTTSGYFLSLTQIFLITVWVSSPAGGFLPEVFSQQTPRYERKIPLVQRQSLEL